MCACMHSKIILHFGPMSGTSVEILSASCEMFSSFEVLVIEYHRGPYAFKVQSHVPVIGKFHNMK